MTTSATTYLRITQAVEALVREHAEETGLSVADLTGRSRVRPVMYARHEVIWLAMRQCVRPRTLVHTQTAIGLVFGGRDRSTIRRLAKRHEDRMAWEADRAALAARWAA